MKTIDETSETQKQKYGNSFCGTPFKKQAKVTASFNPNPRDEEDSHNGGSTRRNRSSGPTGYVRRQEFVDSISGATAEKHDDMTRQDSVLLL
jgi:hypothetical protein